MLGQTALSLMCLFQVIWALVSDPVCKISNLTDLFVYPNDMVTLHWTLDYALVRGSTGYIFGHVTFEPSSSCKTKAQRVVTVPLATRNKTCTHLSGWEPWCHNETDVSLTTNANGSETFSITFSVQSLLKYNMTRNKTIVFSTRLLRNGPSGNGSGMEYNVKVHILDKRPKNKKTNTTPGSTTATYTPTMKPSIRLQSPTPPAKSGNKSQMSSGLIAGIAVIVVIASIIVLGVLVFYCYRSNGNFKRYCQRALNLLPCSWFQAQPNNKVIHDLEPSNGTDNESMHM